MERKDINAFISKYIDESGKPYEALTKFCHYNLDLINQDYNKIISFFSNIYDFSNTMSFKDFEKSKNGEKLYELRYLYDLDEFENLIGLLFAADILIESIITRSEIMHKLKNKNRYLIRDLNKGDNYPEEDYIAYLDKYIIPVHVFTVNKDVIQRQKNSSKKDKDNKKLSTEHNYTNKELEDILTYWFLKDPKAPTFLSFFKSLLDTQLDTILNFIVMMEMFEIDVEVQTTLIFNIMAQTHLNLLRDIEKKYAALSNESLEEFNQYKAEFLEKTVREMKEKNRHL